MGWVRVDDHFSEHPKLARVTPLLWGYWLAGLAYCNRQLTDGFIPAEVALHRLGGYDGGGPEAARRLVEVGLWETVEHGFEIHDYLDYQPSRAQVRGARQQAAERQRRHRGHGERNGARHGERNAPVTPPPTPTPRVVIPDGITSRPELGRLCDLLAAQIRERDPSAKVAPQSKAWLDAARLLLDRDERSVEEVERVLRWLPSDRFWPKVILSMPKLREKFTQLVAAEDDQPRREPERPAALQRMDRWKNAAEYEGRGL